MSIGERIRLKRKQKSMTLEELSRFVGVSRQTLSRYENNIIAVPSDRMELIASSLETTPAYLMGWDDDGLAYKNILPIKTKSVPMLGEIACGEPTFADQQYNAYQEADGAINADFCLKCKGDSMIGDGINNGDIVFIRKQDAVENGEIACVIIDDEATLKHVYISDNNITLIASNTNYPPMVYGEHDAGTIKILGKAVALSRVL